MIKKCSGCGYKLQSVDKKQLGYQPIEKKGEDLCQRCYKIIHYNDAKIVTLPTDKEKILKIVNKDDAYCVFLIDFLNINNTSLDIYKRIKKDKMLVVSKSDIIPFSIKQQKITNLLKEEYKITEDIVYLSSLKNKNINAFMNKLLKKNCSKVYIMGFTNAGKSSLINAIINNYNLSYKTITTSLVPNTTLDFMHIKFNNDMQIIDSPGFTLDQSIYDNNDIGFIKKINTRKHLKPVTYQLKTNCSIVIDDKIKIENLSQKGSFTCYISPNLDIYRTFDEDKLNNLESKEYDIAQNSDLVIKELGFINIKNKSKIKVYISDHSLIEIRNSLFK